jgi:hypothetical protein
MLGHSGSIRINPTLYANSGIDPRKDFTPLGLVPAAGVAGASVGQAKPSAT